MIFFRKLFISTATVFFLASCATSNDQLTSSQMASEQKGAIIYNVRMRGDLNGAEWLILGQYDANAAGYRAVARRVPGSTPSGMINKGNNEPQIYYLKAGSYGILEDTFSGVGTYVISNGGGVNRGTLLNPDFIWNKAIATFEVRSGEYVNIGSLKTFPGISPSHKLTFENSVISDIDPAIMQSFKAKHPEFSERIVTRLMTLTK